MESKQHTSVIDLYVINKVRELREKAGMRQTDLSQHLGLADSFVSNVESEKQRHKYNIRHLNELAKVFKCSPRDFLPEWPI
ncbi:helix-turn-helix domain-containing protein [Chitinophaga sp. NPDC101104]|uniref:helix-turn-helix domain-containing protein n=1 Tax=Chitinophaga sp. NPDC101104 TaxID=3390561 RepID=UPI003D00B652